MCHMEWAVCRQNAELMRFRVSYGEDRLGNHVLGTIDESNTRTGAERVPRIAPGSSI